MAGAKYASPEKGEGATLPGKPQDAWNSTEAGRAPGATPTHKRRNSVVDLLDELGLNDVILMGFSMGGWTAVELATMNSTRLSKMILVDPVGVKTGGREDRDIADVFALPGEKLAELMFHDTSLAPRAADMPQDQLQIMAANRIALGVYTWDPYMHNPKLPHRLHRIKMPTHFIWGESDGIVTVDYGEKYCKLIDGATMTVIEKAGHSPQMEQPAAFVEAVFKFAS